MTRNWRLSTVAAACCLSLIIISAVSQQTTSARAPQSTGQQQIASDLNERLAKFRRVDMPFHSVGLSSREQALVKKLVEASQFFEDIYWRQSDPEGLELLRSLQGKDTPKDVALRRLLMINGSRFDLIRDNQPFVGTAAMSPDHGFYPPGLTREQVEAYVRAHPEQKAALYAPQTIVRREGDRLVTMPYHVVYREWLEPAAKALSDAAALSDDAKFAHFLRLRAKALLDDDYYASDIAWLELENPKFDVIFAPYEVYLDDLLGVKTSYGAAVMIRNEEESRKLALFQKYVPDIQDALPITAADKPSKAGHRSPMEVMDTPFRAGDLRHGYQAVADNLPNDPRIHQEKGSKKIFFKNFMDARVDYVVLPIAKRLLRADQGAQASGDGYLATTMMHEISHELGPAYARTQQGRREINEAIGPAYSALEESKADVVGMFGLDWLIEHGAMPKEKRNEYYASYVGGIFRTVRFGIAEAHGRGEMMEFNYLAEHGAVSRDAASGRYAINAERMPAVIVSLAKELLEQEATGDRTRVEAWFAKYDRMPDDLAKALAGANDIPVDIDPVFSFPETIR
ncbi:MAG TPA: hypothetical protein VFB23_14835 [Candidatus Acidoferrales bacterium]|jgi:hypothetical protein|nr:hypothetical protein [Candidatus Acidoferrales bacterium]